MVTLCTSISRRHRPAVPPESELAASLRAFRWPDLAYNHLNESYGLHFGIVYVTAIPEGPLASVVPFAGSPGVRLVLTTIRGLAQSVIDFLDSSGTTYLGQFPILRIYSQ